MIPRGDSRLRQESRASRYRAREEGCKPRRDYAHVSVMIIGLVRGRNFAGR